MKTETHPYNHEQIPSGTEMLIVGTTPPPRFTRKDQAHKKKPGDFEFFYGARRNFMWEFLPLQKRTREDAQKYLRGHKLWMRDVLETFQRTSPCAAADDSIRSASDIKQRPLPSDFTDFKSIFEQNTSLKRLAFTSEQAAKWTLKMLQHQNLIGWETINLDRKVPEEPLENYIKVKFLTPRLQRSIMGRDVDFYILPSPSPRSTYPKKEDKALVYKKVLSL